VPTSALSKLDSEVGFGTEDRRRFTVDAYSSPEFTTITTYKPTAAGTWPGVYLRYLDGRL